MATTYRVLSETVKRDAKNIRLKFEVTDDSTDPPTVTTHDFAMRLPVSTHDMHREIVRQITASRALAERVGSSDASIPPDMSSGVSVDTDPPPSLPDETIAPVFLDEDEPVEEE